MKILAILILDNPDLIYFNLPHSGRRQWTIERRGKEGQGLGVGGNLT
jgi:hypothetical protein